MGLLNEVFSKESSPELNEAGKALRDRLIRLSSKKSSAYTALSLLKGYGSFKIGACLELKDETYKSYASVGLGVSKISIPAASVEHTGEEQSFFKILNPESFGLTFFTPGLNFWIFALDELRPYRYLLLAAEEDDSGFNPQAIALIISETNKIFFPSESSAEPASGGFDLDLPKETNGEEEIREDIIQKNETPMETPIPKVEAEETAEGVRAKIAGYHQGNFNFQGILLEAPEGSQKNSNTSFPERVSIMAGALGLIVVLPSRRVLILFPPRLDRELIAHRLSTSLATEALVCFEADNPDKTLELIRPYL
ncbi:MAG: hypothetical protein LBR99_03435 [Treponema sp.]|jgi:hypothetical protein|nr:hypothetical protein [Treponema sp.]